MSSLIGKCTWIHFAGNRLPTPLVVVSQYKKDGVELVDLEQPYIGIEDEFPIYEPHLKKCQGREVKGLALYDEKELDVSEGLYFRLTNYMLRENSHNMEKALEAVRDRPNYPFDEVESA